MIWTIFVRLPGSDLLYGPIRGLRNQSPANMALDALKLDCLPRGVLLKYVGRQLPADPRTAGYRVRTV
jgi:hypothetical protein